MHNAQAVTLGKESEQHAAGQQADCDPVYQRKGGSTPPTPAPENLTPPVTLSPAREATPPLLFDSRWDFGMAQRLFALDGLSCPVPLPAEFLALLGREFPHRRAAKEALALLEGSVLP